MATACSEGADYAAKEMADGIEIYVQPQAHLPRHREAQAVHGCIRWHQNGSTEVISDGGAVGNPVMAAEEKSAAPIGVDVDQSEPSDYQSSHHGVAFRICLRDGVKEISMQAASGGKTPGIFSWLRRTTASVSDGDLQAHYEIHTGELQDDAVHAQPK